ncbi:MAG: hypothetical protein PF495_12490 [Spirochaetales bacterium]|jgi:hypothetical protein|nr:hypothetical protein [Spirochaetales bacterium]
MPTTLGPKYSTAWRGRPPHMLAPDIPVWYRFLEEWAGQFVAIYYDCLLGGPGETENDDTDKMAKMWRALTSKRADVIAETKDEVWIIEVSANPGMRALGQLLTYETLWKEDPKIDKPVVKVLVGDQIDPDVRVSFKPYGVVLYLV